MVPTQPFRGRLDPLECGEVCVGPLSNGALFPSSFLTLGPNQTVSRMELGVIKLWACCEVLRCFEEWVACDGIWIFIGSMPSDQEPTEGREGLREELFFFCTHPC